MPTNVLLPQWGMNMQEGTLTKWLKKEGDVVKQGDLLVEVETAKINSELEAPAAGIIARILVAEGDTVSVGTTLAILADTETEADSIAAETNANINTLPSSPENIMGSEAPPVHISSPNIDVQVVPAARRLASQNNIDLSQVRGSGPAGRILVHDVERAVESTSGLRFQEISLTGLRQTIAERMLQSAQNTASVTLVTEVDMTKVVALRRTLVSAWRSKKIRPMDQDFIVMAVAQALAKNPLLNATLERNVLKLYEDVNVGIAMALSDGLRVGVVSNTNHKRLLEIAQEIRILATKGRENTLSPDDVSGGTFTVTSLANVDVDLFSPLINPPQVAILGIGRVVEKPAVFEGNVAVRSMMYLNLTFDHRAMDGVPAGQFLQAVKGFLESPDFMAI